MALCGQLAVRMVSSVLLTFCMFYFAHSGADDYVDITVTVSNGVLKKMHEPCVYSIEQPGEWILLILPTEIDIKLFFF